MKKGTAINLPHGSDEAAAVAAVRAKYSEKIRSSDGWYGQAVVNIAADDDKKGGRTLIVKAVKNGFQVFALLGSIMDKVTVKAGAFKTA